MRFAERLSSLRVKTLPLQIFRTNRACETIRMVCVTKCLHPPIAGLDGELAVEAFRCEKSVPVSFTVWQAVLQEKRRIPEWSPAMSAGETVRMPLFGYCIQTIPENFGAAFAAR